MSCPLTFPPPLGVPGFVDLLISMLKLFVIFLKVSFEALSVASLIDNPIIDSVDIDRITRKMTMVLSGFLHTYVKAFLITANLQTTFS